MAIDPVCGMEVEEDQAVAQSKYKGQTYYFFSEDDKQIFDKEPERYIQKATRNK